MKVLVVDDSKSVQSFVRSCLAGSHYEILGVENGKLAVKEIKKGNHYGILLLDWEMPVMTGPETVKELIKLKNEIPILMMTTRNSPEDIQSMLDLGVKDYIMKPFTKDIILAKLEVYSAKKFENAG